MPTININTFIKDSLYNEIYTLTEEMSISQEELFIIAIENYLQRRKNQNLLHSINDAYADGLDASEEVMLEQIRRHQQQLFD